MIAGDLPQNAMAQQMMMSQMAARGGMPGGMNGMPGMGGNQPGAAPVAIPQALGPKAPGKLRIGIAPTRSAARRALFAAARVAPPLPLCVGAAFCESTVLADAELLT